MGSSLAIDCIVMTWVAATVAQNVFDRNVLSQILIRENEVFGQNLRDRCPPLYIRIFLVLNE